MNTEKKHELDEDVAALIRFKARQLVGKYGFKSTDREDIEQDLTLDYLKREERLDPRRAPRMAFIRIIVNRSAASLIRKRTCASRDFRRSIQTSAGVAGNEHSTREVADISQVAHVRDLQLDLADAMDTLETDLREVAKLLTENRQAEVARQRNCSRDEMLRIIKRIRQHFESLGLRDYYPRKSKRGCVYKE